jgi:hypothetical protein
MLGRKARRARVVGDAGQSDRSRILDQRPQQSLALREVPDPLDCPRGHAHVHELGQSTRRRDHSQRRIARTHQLARRLHDPPEQHRQRQIPDHHLASPQQTPQPPLRGHHLLRPLHQLPQQLVQLQAGQIGEGQRNRLIGRPVCTAIGHGIPLPSARPSVRPVRGIGISARQVFLAASRRTRRTRTNGSAGAPAARPACRRGTTGCHRPSALATAAETCRAGCWRSAATSSSEVGRKSV